MARQVSHPHVCRVWDVGEAEGQHFISMEFVDGENLASLLRRIGRLPGDKALEIAQQVTAGLAAAHDKGVLHRDLKPANVMLDDQGKVRLTDFGLAGLAESLGDDDVRSGTPSYMSPEQLQGREVTFRSDIYSLGLLLYELFTGRRAFEGRSVAELTRKHRDEHPIEPSAIVPDLAPAVERTILACLEKEPRRRPPSALAVAAMLGRPRPARGRDRRRRDALAGAGRRGGGAHRACGPRSRGRASRVVVARGAARPVARQTHALLARVPVERSPAALEDRARDLLARLGTTAPAADTAKGLSADEEYLHQVAQNDGSPSRWDAAAHRRAAGRAVLVPPEPAARSRRTGSTARVTAADPPPTCRAWPACATTCAAGWWASTSCRRSSRGGRRARTPRPAPDWARALRRGEARRRGASSRSPPQWTPPFYCDTRAAWEGPGRRGRTSRSASRRPATAAGPCGSRSSTRGRAPSATSRTSGRSASACRSRAARRSSPCCSSAARSSPSATCGSAAATGAAPSAWRRRCSRSGCRAGCSSRTTSRTRRRSSCWQRRGAGLALVLAALLWLFYLALEPYVRRERPVDDRLLDAAPRRGAARRRRLARRALWRRVRRAADAVRRFPQSACPPARSSRAGADCRLPGHAAGPTHEARPGRGPAAGRGAPLARPAAAVPGVPARAAPRPAGRAGGRPGRSRC